jgi:predicted RNase H-like HicB family nuclease
MNQDTYSVMIFWSDDDAAFVASVPDLPGCMAHGETRAEAAEQIGIAIQNWIETAREIGRQIPSPPKDMAQYMKELDQKAEQTIKAGIENAVPSLVETLTKILKEAEAHEKQIRDVIHNRPKVFVLSEANKVKLRSRMSRPQKTPK